MSLPKGGVALEAPGRLPGREVGAGLKPGATQSSAVPATAPQRGIFASSRLSKTCRRLTTNR